MIPLRPLLPIVCALLLGAWLSCTTKAGSTKDAAYVRYGVVTPLVQVALASDWTDEVPQVERGYCATYIERSLDSVQTVLLVTGIRLPVIERSTTSTVLFQCRPSEVTLHTHPPQTCYTDGTETACVPSGASAYQCTPSGSDIVFVRAAGHPFGIVQCGRFHYVFFEPTRRAK